MSSPPAASRVVGDKLLQEPDSFTYSGTSKRRGRGVLGFPCFRLRQRLCFIIWQARNGRVNLSFLPLRVGRRGFILGNGPLVHGGIHCNGVEVFAVGDLRVWRLLVVTWFLTHRI
jgi:hypothetical protein